ALASYQQQTVPPVDTATMLANYRHWVQQQYGTMQVFGMSQPVPLGDIYTNVHVLDQPTASRRFNPEEQQARFRHSQRDHGQREKRQAGLSMVESTSRLFILGKPGAGKTTFLKHLAVQTAAGALLPGKLPIFISLKALADSGYPLLTFAARQLVGGGMVAAETWLERWLHDGTLL
ncbi:MAG: NACHT domain-containing protein, partial [Anaerolineales bacterium]|nr:NACHT domain-containing protein [Anaerolineales bacterium]